MYGVYIYLYIYTLYLKKLKFCSLQNPAICFICITDEAQHFSYPINPYCLVLSGSLAVNNCNDTIFLLLHKNILHFCVNKFETNHLLFSKHSTFIYSFKSRSSGIFSLFSYFRFKSGPMQIYNKFKSEK